MAVVKHFESLGAYVLFVLIAFAFSCYIGHLHVITTREYDKATTEMLLNGTAMTPFQFRILPYILMDLIRNITTFPLYKIMIGLDVLGNFIYVLLFERFLSGFIKERFASYIISFAVFLVFPFNYLLPRMILIPNVGAYASPVFYSYDVYSLAFFTMGLLLLHRQSMLPYYLVFAVATLNRETTLFLIAVYLFVSFGKEKPLKLIAHCMAQGLIWIGIKFVMHSIYRNNTGEMYETPLRINILALKEPYVWLLLITNLGGLWIPVILWYRRIRDHFLRRALLVAVPYLAGMFYVGNLYELRIFGELTPLFLCATAIILRSLLLSETTINRAIK